VQRAAVCGGAWQKGAARQRRDSGKGRRQQVRGQHEAGTAEWCGSPPSPRSLHRKTGTTINVREIGVRQAKWRTYGGEAAAEMETKNAKMEVVRVSFSVGTESEVSRVVRAARVVAPAGQTHVYHENRQKDR